MKHHNDMKDTDKTPFTSATRHLANTSLLLISGLSLSAAPQIIIKADDVGNRGAQLEPAWQRFVDLIEAKDIQASIGLVTDSLEADNEAFLAWIRDQHDSGLIEFWHHGYDHSRERGVSKTTWWEFRNTDYEKQKFHFERGMELGKEKLGITFRTFGSPYNANDATTVKVLEENPDLRIWLYPPNIPSSKLPLKRIGALNIERPVGVINFEPFASNYPDHTDEDVLVLQCHPGNWDENSWSEFEKIVDFLKVQGATFTTPTAYFGIEQKRKPVEDTVTQLSGAREVETVRTATGAHPALYDAAAAANEWETTFHDCGTKDWTENWFLDGKIAAVENTPYGMELRAGPRFGVNSHHMVLWTKDVFKGDLKIEFDYTRLDFAKRAVNIIYIQAQGSGPAPYESDIRAWRHLREAPTMSQYFNHMETYHVSFAAFANTWDDNDGYLRGRRYVGRDQGLRGTELDPEYLVPESLFEPGVPHHISIIKRNRDLYLRIKREGLTYDAHFQNEPFGPILSGRIGLRHMFSRSARYQDISISLPSDG
jgi:peptidoglycan/xylan/chitin deacetylase (PgdA/CDA1 family)